MYAWNTAAFEGMLTPIFTLSTRQLNIAHIKTVYRYLLFNFNIMNWHQTQKSCWKNKEFNEMKKSVQSLDNHVKEWIYAQRNDISWFEPFSSVWLNLSGFCSVFKVTKVKKWNLFKYSNCIHLRPFSVMARVNWTYKPVIFVVFFSTFLYLT